MPAVVWDQPVHKSRIRVCLLFSPTGLSVRREFALCGRQLMSLFAQEGKVLYLPSGSLSICLIYLLGDSSAQPLASSCNKCTAASTVTNASD